MPPRPFSEIPNSTYLYGKSDTNPEEKVRQWALFELLSTYGYPITSIKIEFPVKVATTNILADIVVLKDGYPYIVIECKQEDANENDSGWEQVLSYADPLRAEFAVWTNGHTWRVKRKISGKWCGIADIPVLKNSSTKNIVDHLEALTELARVFYWHNRSVPSEHVSLFFETVALSMSSGILRKLSDVPECLLEGFIQLCYLASESGAPELFTDVELQRHHIERLVIVLRHFEKYFEFLGFDGRWEHLSGRYRIDRDIQYLTQYIWNGNKINGFNESIDRPKQVEDFRQITFWPTESFSSCIQESAQRHADLPNHTAAFLGACEAVSRYLVEQHNPTESPILLEGQVDQILKVFVFTYLVPLNLSLPSKIDPSGTRKLHNWCEYHWQTLVDLHNHAEKVPECKVVMPGDPKWEDGMAIVRQIIEDISPNDPTSTHWQDVLDDMQDQHDKILSEQQPTEPPDPENAETRI